MATRKRAGDDSQSPGSDGRLTAAVVDGVRRGNESALKRAFEVLYVRLIPIARASSIPGYAPAELVTAFLDEFLLDLPPLDLRQRPIVPYAITSFRNYQNQLLRSDAVRVRHSEGAARSADDGSERVIAECHSQYSIHASNVGGSPNDSENLSPLVAHLVGSLSSDDEELLRLLGRGLTVKDAAKELGADYGACRVRLHRLRVRLRVSAMAYAERAGAGEKKTLARFFRRLENANRPTQRATNG